MAGTEQSPGKLTLGQNCLHAVLNPLFSSFDVLLQLFSPESFAGKLRIAAEKHSLFVVIGVLNAGTIAALGVMTFFVPAWPQLVTDLAIAVGGVTGVRTSGWCRLGCLKAYSVPPQYLLESVLT